MSDYRMSDTKRADGCYVTFHRIVENHDQDADPREYLFQDEDYRDEDQARLDAWRNGEWHFIGVQAQAAVYIVRNGVGTRYTLYSPGLWGVESDSGDEYLGEIFRQECDAIREDLAAMGTLIEEG